MSDEYAALLNHVDSIAERLTERYRPHLICRAGCCACCGHDLSVFEVEAAAVRAALIALPCPVQTQVVLQAVEVQARKAQGDSVICPMLVNDCCAIYRARPVICRTQGLPLLYTAEDGTQEVDFCRLNFAGPGAIQDLDTDHLVQLDQLNLKLASTNLGYCRNVGLQPKQCGNRKPMSTLILETGTPHSFT